MPNLRLLVEYDGANFHGWQRQPGVRTIEEELARALKIVLREEIGPIYAAGRTDAGVHARGQVVNLNVTQIPDLPRLLAAVGSLLKGEVAIRSAGIVSDEFHARFDAKAKEYRYTILNRPAPPTLMRGRAWHISAPLNWEKMQEEVQSLIGLHDYSSFRASGCNAKSPVREIFESEIIKTEELIIFRVVGNGFLKQMIRNLTGTLVDLVRGKLDFNSLVAVLKAHDRKCAGVTAPPYGLCLEQVLY